MPHHVCSTCPSTAPLRSSPCRSSPATPPVGCVVRNSRCPSTSHQLLQNCTDRYSYRIADLFCTPSSGCSCRSSCATTRRPRPGPASPAPPPFGSASSSPPALGPASSAPPPSRSPLRAACFNAGRYPTLGLCALVLPGATHLGAHAPLGRIVHVVDSPRHRHPRRLPERQLRS